MFTGDEKSIDVARGVSVKLSSITNGANKNMNVNGSITPAIFQAKPPLGKKWRITRMVGYLEGVNPFGAEKFADLLALANGVEVLINGQIITTWKTNRDIASSIPALSAPKALGKEDRTLAGVWNIQEAFGNSILVDDLNGIQFKIKDDLSTITAFYVTVQGQEV